MVNNYEVQTNSGTCRWSEYATSTPADEIQHALKALTEATGENNGERYRFLCAEQVWNRLKFHPQLQAKVYQNRSKAVSAKDLASVFGVAGMDVSTDAARNRWLRDGFLIYVQRTEGTDDVVLPQLELSLGSSEGASPPRCLAAYLIRTGV